MARCDLQKHRKRYGPQRSNVGAGLRVCPTDDLSMIAAESGDDDSTAETVREAISKLSASAREVIFLRYYDGMSYEQISVVLGISEQAINGRLRRAKKKMADYLRRNGFGEV